MKLTDSPKVNLGGIHLQFVIEHLCLPKKELSQLVLREKSRICVEATKENAMACSSKIKVQNMSGAPCCLEDPGSAEVQWTGRALLGWEIVSSSEKAQAQQGS